jgi:hypothetical protein
LTYLDIFWGRGREPANPWANYQHHPRDELHGKKESSILDVELHLGQFGRWIDGGLFVLVVVEV